MNSLIIINCLVMLMHLLILLSIIPYQYTWGGRLKTDSEMYVFEAVSLLINAFFIFVLLQKSERIRPFLSAKTINLVLWVFFILFALNTIGNIVAKTMFEKMFAIITLYNAFCLWKIIRSKTKERNPL